MRVLFRFSFISVAFLVTACVGLKDGKRSAMNPGLLASLGLAAGQNGSPVAVNEWAQLGSKGSNSIDAQTGGYIQLGRNVTLSIPAGAIDQDTEVSIQAIAKPSSFDGVTPLLLGYQLEPEGLQFSKPAQLTLCYPIQELNLQGLAPSMAQIYWKDDDGNFVEMGGSASQGCVTSAIEHFSTYVAGAQALVPVNSPPSVSTTANFLPATPVADVPLRIRAIITSFQTGNNGAIAAAYVFWRKVGAATYTQSVLTPDTVDTATPNRYSFLIPASSVTTAGIQYYFQAIDNLGKVRTTPVRTRTITRSATGITLAPAAALTIASGFARDYTVSVTNNVSGPQNMSADAFNVSGGVGNASKVAPSTIRFVAGATGTGALNASAGAFSASAPIQVQPGQLTNVVILDSLGVAITGLITLSTGQTYQFDAIGYDAFGNQILVNPTFSVSGGIGSVNTSGLLTASGSSASGDVTVTLAGLSASVPVYVASTAKDITSFSFSSPAVTATITGNNIAATVPAGTNVTNLAPDFVTTGVSVKVGANVQTSGSTPNDFTVPVVYTVTAEDGTFQDYTVTVTRPIFAVQTTANRVLGAPDLTSSGPMYAADRLNLPFSVAVDAAGGVYAASGYGYQQNGTAILYYAPGASAPSRFYGPYASGGQGGPPNDVNIGYIEALAVDPAGGVYAGDMSHFRYLYFPPASTTATMSYGTGGSLTTGGTLQSNGMALDALGGLYVSESWYNRVLYYPPGSLTPSRVYGQAGNFSGSTANLGGISADSLYRPTAVAVDSSGGLYIGDTQNYRVLYYPPGTTTATRVYGQAGSFTTQNQTATGPDVFGGFVSGLAVDGVGGLYVSDYYNNRILYFPSGSTTAIRVYGQADFTSNARNGGGGVSATALSNPRGIALDFVGGLYVADTGNNRVVYFPQ